MCQLTARIPSVLPVVARIQPRHPSSISLWWLRPGAPRSKQLFHYGKSGRFNHTALPHSSLRQPTTAASMTTAWLRWHACHCCHKAQPPSMPKWLLGMESAGATVVAHQQIKARIILGLDGLAMSKVT
ncbi:hypothetical protein EYF80_024942 [Liparis tanakae]|uniref:Uncharacterized protein n=1 Tax=Liparis tanakae TaxID=230148 RepID=A0A4Z2HGX2_9TELE|nr:hypothetical protein EYF80_024942 [Liparis tanakae]